MSAYEECSRIIVDAEVRRASARCVAIDMSRHRQSPSIELSTSDDHEVRFGMVNILEGDPLKRRNIMGKMLLMIISSCSSLAAGRMRLQLCPCAAGGAPLGQLPAVRLVSPGRKLTPISRHFPSISRSSCIASRLFVMCHVRFAIWILPRVSPKQFSLVGSMLRAFVGPPMMASSQWSRLRRGQAYVRASLGSRSLDHPRGNGYCSPSPARVIPPPGSQRHQALAAEDYRSLVRSLPALSACRC